MFVRTGGCSPRVFRDANLCRSGLDDVGPYRGGAQCSGGARTRAEEPDTQARGALIGHGPVTNDDPMATIDAHLHGLVSFRSPRCPGGRLLGQHARQLRRSVD
jgi:hypothetical protein